MAPSSSKLLIFTRRSRGLSPTWAAASGGVGRSVTPTRGTNDGRLSCRRAIRASSSRSCRFVADDGRNPLAAGPHQVVQLGLGQLLGIFRNLGKTIPAAASHRRRPGVPLASGPGRFPPWSRTPPVLRRDRPRIRRPSPASPTTCRSEDAAPSCKPTIVGSAAVLSPVSTDSDVDVMVAVVGPVAEEGDLQNQRSRARAVRTTVNLRRPKRVPARPAAGRHR